MLKGSNSLKIRKIHRYLGIFMGIQFLMWTISGIYFSWTDIDEIHGDQFKDKEPVYESFTGLISPDSLENKPSVKFIELRQINGNAYYWINKKTLYDAKTGKSKKGIDEKEALSVAKQYLKDNLIVTDIQLITKTNEHHEYRERLLPAYIISYEHEDEIKVYVSVSDGAFQTIRHRSWRWFDFLWMTHTMDYQGRDNFNTFILRAFSLLGLITVLSGFLLWYISSPSIRKLKKNRNPGKKVG
ncbi:MAG: hypothetical protein DRJ10_02320 [Bacteroidetes bacterium]|nr:MAG: hypothetical protein DRJ10_02320 [Bacteroidota bacterium]